MAAGGEDALSFRVAPGGATEIWTRATHHFANGHALHPHGTHLYVVESTLPGVTRVPINANGSAGEVAEVIHLPQTVPDGLAFDREGNLYISCYRPDRIYRLFGSGEWEIVAEDWAGTALAAPTNVAFFGRELESLAIASLARWSLSAIDAGFPRQPLRHPAISRNL